MVAVHVRFNGFDGFSKFNRYIIRRFRRYGSRYGNEWCAPLQFGSTAYMTWRVFGRSSGRGRGTTSTRRG